MTVKEAIEGLKHIFSEHELLLPFTDSLEIYQKSIEALEKQIPKRLGKVFTGEKRYYNICPYCKARQYTIEKHCYNCGQAIDLSTEYYCSETEE